MKINNKPNLPFLVVSLFAFASVALNLFFYQKILQDNTVVEVVDGDTFQLKSGKRIRLAGIDAPDLEDCGYQPAKERLTQLLLNKKVKLTEEETEAYGRSKALVFEGNKFINKIMLEEGWADTDYDKTSRREELTEAYHYGNNNNLGKFALCRIEAGIEILDHCNIKGNIDSSTGTKFYHLPNCKHYKQIVLNLDRGEKLLCSEEEALAEGFQKASGCP